MLEDTSALVHRREKAPANERDQSVHMQGMDTAYLFQRERGARERSKGADEWLQRFVVRAGSRE